MKFLKSNAIKVSFKLIVSIVLLFLIFRFIDLNQAYTELISANIFYILLSVLFLVFPIYFKAIRWKYIVQLFNIHISLARSVIYTFISVAFGNITPGRVGEFIKAKFLVDKTNINYLKSVMTIVIDKIFDILALVLLGLWGFSFLGEIVEGSQYFIYVFALYLLILILIFVYFDKAIALLYRILPGKYKSGYKKLNIKRGFYVKSIVFSLLIWLFIGLQAFFVLKAIGVSPSLYLVMGLIPLMAISSMIPISIGGVGVRELVAISFLLVAGVSVEKSTIFSLFFTLINVVLPTIIGAILHVKEKSIL